MTIFTDNTTSIHGDIGRKWLGDLDSIVADLAKKWNLTDLKPFDNLTFNYVLSGFQNDVPIAKNTEKAKFSSHVYTASAAGSDLAQKQMELEESTRSIPDNQQ